MAIVCMDGMVGFKEQQRMDWWGLSDAEKYIN